MKKPPQPPIILEPRREGDIRRVAEIIARMIWEQAKKDMLQSTKDAA